ncbi:hypothetical protein AC578_9754 [Pseudocercospora eumusae]|uniref:Zygote-specific protein n=1 Tax=Pseudocercospora eumusae TaxID=321146 RepID=A0A139HQT0_9PEZI|nr:hypothetical protein AC578_9754 [Pseudocercospora eumusae]
MKFTKIALPILASFVPLVKAGPAAYGVCQAGCAGLAVACYAAAGFTFGVALPAAPPAILACNATFGSCQAACWAALFTPTP